MKFSLVFLRLAVLAIVLPSYSAAVYASDNEGVGVDNTPIIYFAGEKDGQPDGGNTCSITIKAGQYKFAGGDNNNCKNDDMYYYRLDNAPSPALITLHAEDDCRSGSSDNDWNFQLRVYINPTTGTWRKISDLKGLSPGDIVVRGVMFEKGWYNKGSIGGKLSCVTIDY